MVRKIRVADRTIKKKWADIVSDCERLYLFDHQLNTWKAGLRPIKGERHSPSSSHPPGPHGKRSANWHGPLMTAIATT
jgi:hypothetical protein